MQRLDVFLLVSVFSRAAAPFFNVLYRGVFQPDELDQGSRSPAA